MNWKQRDLRPAIGWILMGTVLLSTLLLVLHPFFERNVTVYASHHTQNTIPQLTPLPAAHPFNSADITLLDNMPGIGQVIGQRIIDDRMINGLFYFPEDIMYVKGVGKKRFADMMTYIADMETTPTDLSSEDDFPRNLPE